MHGAGAVIREGKNGAYVAGVTTCGSIWACPVCAGKIAEARRQEVEHVLDGHATTGGHQFMVSFTMSHAATDLCSTLKTRVMGAWKRVLQDKRVRALKIAFNIHWLRNLEVTLGRNGWHPHIHAIFCTRALSDLEASQLHRCLRSAWIRAVEVASLAKWPSYRDAVRHAVDFQRAYKASQAGNYVAKWGVDSEIARAVTKVSKKGGRTPWSLLLDSANGDKGAGYRFREYAAAFKGARHIAYSRDFRSKFIVDCPELTDEQIAAQKLPFNGDTVHLIVPRPIWKDLTRRGLVATLLDATEARGTQGAVDFLRANDAGWDFTGMPSAPL